MEALARYCAGDGRALAALAALIEDDDVDVRTNVARGLAHFGDRGVPYLEKLIDGEDTKLGGVNQAVVNSLARIATKRASAALKKLSTVRGDIGRLTVDMPRLVASARAANQAAARARDAKRSKAANASEASAEAKSAAEPPSRR